MSQQINLFNPVFLKKKKVFSALAMMQSLLLVAVGLVALSFYIQSNIGREQALARRVKVSLEDSQAKLVKATDSSRAVKPNPQLQAEVAKLEARLASSRQLLDYARAGAIDEQNGYSGYFLAFSRRSLQGVWLTGFSLNEGGRQVDIQGRALNAQLVPAYIRALHQEPLLQGKSFATMNLQSQGADSQRSSPAAPATSATPAAMARNESGNRDFAAVLNSILPGAAAVAAQPQGAVSDPASARLPFDYVDFSLSSSENDKRAERGDRK